MYMIAFIADFVVFLKNALQFVFAELLVLYILQQI